MWRWWRACRPAAYQANRGRMHRLARFSSQRLHALTHELHLEYEQARGVLVLLRGARDLAQAQPSLRCWASLRCAYELLDARPVPQLEPGLNPAMPLQAGIPLPQRRGGQLPPVRASCSRPRHSDSARSSCSHTTVRSLRCAPPRHQRDGAHIPAQAGPHAEASFDAVLLCAGTSREPLLEPWACDCRPAPAWHGYSVTAPLRNPEAPPRRSARRR